MEHTPGPWQELGTAIWAGADGTLLVAQAKEKAARRRPTRKEADANARLIASAPELLEALKLFVAAVEQGHDAMLVTAEKRAKSVIAKAQGGG